MDVQLTAISAFLRPEFLLGLTPAAAEELKPQLVQALTTLGAPPPRKGNGGLTFTDATELKPFTVDIVDSLRKHPTKHAVGQQLFARALLNVKGSKGGLYLWSKRAVLGLAATPTAERPRVTMKMSAKHWPTLEANVAPIDCYVTYDGDTEAVCIGAATNLRYA